MSLGVVIFVVALSITATGAFFSDTETSTGNTFTAGAIDLTVDSVQHYNGMVCVAFGEGHVWAPSEDVSLDLNNQPVLDENNFAAFNLANPLAYPQAGTACNGTWEATDLGAEMFWNFTDVKPGDEGENTISLHIDSNPAWACIDVSLTKNDDMNCNDPENGVEGVSCPLSETVPDGDLFDGDLAQNLKFAAWADDGDNIWELGEPLLFSNQSGPASDVLGGKTYTLADSLGGVPLPGGSTSYIGLAWCAGTQTINGNNTISCNGAGMGNEVQTDSMTANVTFRVEQHRNNPNFLCEPEEEEVPLTGTVTLDKIVTFSNGAIAGVDVTDYVLHLVGPGGDHILVDETAFPGLTPGAYVVSEVYSGEPGNVISNATFSGSCTEIDTTDTATLNVVAGVNPTCTITNSVALAQ